MSFNRENCQVITRWEVELQNMYKASGFVKTRHKTIEAGVNHQEMGVSKFEASAYWHL